MSFRTPDEFPGERIDESILLVSGSLIPAKNGEFAYVSGSGFRFYDEGILKGLTTVTSSFSITSSFALVAVGSVLQDKFIEQTLDTTTTSMTFIPLFSGTLNVQSPDNKIEVVFTSASSIDGGSNVGAAFQLLIDNVAKRGTMAGLGVGANTSPGQSCALTYITSSLSAGNHTFEIQWSVTSALRAAQIRPTSTIFEHAAMTIKEIKS